MEWLIVLLCLVLIGLIPIGVIFRYDQGAVQVRLIVGFIRFAIYPKKKKENKSKHTKAKKKESFEGRVAVKKDKRNISDYFPLLQLVLDFLTDFRTKLRINDLRFKVILAGGDPCDLSINFGKAWIALGNLMPLLERCFVIKKRNLQVECDYTADSTLISGYVDMTVSVAHILMMGGYHGVKLLRKYLQIMNNAKDGAAS